MPERYEEKVGSEENDALHVTGLREKKLIALIAWLAVLSLLTLLLFAASFRSFMPNRIFNDFISPFQLNLLLINVLQMTHHGMRSLKVHTYVDEKTGEEDAIVHFAAPNVNLGHVVVKSGKVVGSRDDRLTLQGSRVRSICSTR